MYKRARVDGFLMSHLAPSAEKVISISQRTQPAYSTNRTLSKHCPSQALNHSPSRAQRHDTYSPLLSSTTKENCHHVVSAQLCRIRLYSKCRSRAISTRLHQGNIRSILQSILRATTGRYIIHSHIENNVSQRQEVIIEPERTGNFT